jgi:hypothetical protein
LLSGITLPGFGNNKKQISPQVSSKLSATPSYAQFRPALTKDTISFNRRLHSETTNALSAKEIQDLKNEIDRLEKKGIKYFLDHRLKNGLVLDRASNNIEKTEIDTPPMASIAATGYSLTAIVQAVEKNMISESKGRKMVLQTLNFINNNNPEINGGWFAHFLEPETGKTYPHTEISSVDTALFYFNAFIAAEYFGGEVKNKVEEMYNKIDFNLMLSPKKQAFCLGFHVIEGKRLMFPYLWDEYSEGILVPLLALGNDKIPETVWTEGWNREKQWTYGEDSNFVRLPLFTYFYPQGLLNMKDQVDSQGDNFWEASKKAVKMQINYCKDNNYPAGLFGITACDGPNGYQAYQPGGTKEFPAHDGTIAPPAVLACMPFAENHVLKNLKKFKELNLLQDKYGINNAYNVKTGWKTEDALGIDIGSMLLMLDAHNEGLLHKLSDKNPIVQKIKNRAGFKSISH